MKGPIDPLFVFQIFPSFLQNFRYLFNIACSFEQKKEVSFSKTLERSPVCFKKKLKMWGLLFNIQYATMNAVENSSPSSALIDNYNHVAVVFVVRCFGFLLRFTELRARLPVTFNSRVTGHTDFLMPHIFFRDFFRMFSSICSRIS